MNTITINDIEIKVTKKDIKNLHLSVNPPDGDVRISSPLKVGDDSIRLFAISKLNWIKKQQYKYLNQERQTKREYVSGESHYFNGQRYLLNIVYTNGKPFVKIRNKKYIDLYIRRNTPYKKRKEIITDWYRLELKEQIPLLIDKWEKIIGVTVNKWQVRKMRTKWGSCNIEKKTIYINLELVKKPEGCLEYIIVHEMVHLLIRHHNENFVTYMDKFLPNWTYYKEMLNQFILDEF